MNETGEISVDFYDFSGLRHLSQDGIELLEYYTTFICIPVELQQFFKRTIDYYSMRKQKDGELDLYADLPYSLRPWDDLKDYEAATAQPANNNEEGSRPEDNNDFPGYDPTASACAGASTPLHDPFDRDSPASPMFQAPLSPAMDNGYDDPSPSPVYREKEEQLQESQSRNEEEVDHSERPAGSIALIGKGTFYNPFVIIDEPSPPETVDILVKAESIEAVAQERSASNQSPTITSSMFETADESQHPVAANEAEQEHTASGSTDPFIPPEQSLFQGIQEFLHEEANLTLILPEACPSPTDLQIDESEDTADDEDEVTTKPDEHRDANEPTATESTPTASAAIDDPINDQLIEEEKEAPMELTNQTEAPAAYKTVENLEIADAKEIIDPIMETQEDEEKEGSKEKEEPPRKRRRFSWNESSSAESTETAAVENSVAGTSSSTPAAPPAASPAEEEKPGNSSLSSDPPTPTTPPSIPRSSISTSSEEKSKQNSTVVTNKKPQDATLPSTPTVPPDHPPVIDGKQDNSSPASDPPALSTPPPIPTSSTAKPFAAAATNHKPQTAQPAHHSHQPHNQRQPHAPKTNKQIPMFTPTRPPPTFHVTQPPPSFQPMNGPFSHPPPNMMGGGFSFHASMQGAPLQQMGASFHRQNVRPYPPPGANPWNSEWVPLSTWSPPNGPPHCPPNVHWTPVGPFGPLSAQHMVNGPPGFQPGQYFCDFCDCIQPHASQDCNQFETYGSRQARARDLNLCQHCLGKHNPRSCPSQRQCPRCGLHNSHVAFCLYR